METPDALLDQQAAAATATVEEQATAVAVEGGGGGGGGTHICPTCSRTFATRRNLTRHAANHNTIKSYICTHVGCGKAFARSDLLLRHTRLHARPGGLSGTGSAISSSNGSNGDVHHNHPREQSANDLLGAVLPSNAATILSPAMGSHPLPPPQPPMFDSQHSPSLSGTHSPFSFTPHPPALNPSALQSPHPQPPATAVHHPLPIPPPNHTSTSTSQFNDFVHQSALWSSNPLLPPTFPPHHTSLGSGSGAMDLSHDATGLGFEGLQDFGFGMSGMGMSVGMGYSGGAGAGAGGPGWEMWDSSLSWLVEGAVSRVGSPAGGLGGQQPFHALPSDPLLDFPPPAPPSTSQTSHSPSLSNHSKHNLNTLASVAAAAVCASPSPPQERRDVEEQQRVGTRDRGDGYEERDARWPQHFDPRREGEGVKREREEESEGVGAGERRGMGVGAGGGEKDHPAAGEEELPALREPAEGSERWRRFWVDEQTLGRVGNVCDLARFMPGGNERAFHLPHSLHTVNHLLSNYFEHVLPMLPIVHIPTFSTSQAAPLVLAAMMCIGANFSALPGAHRFSLDIAEQIRRALAALYEHDLTNLRSEHIMHASLLTCIAGLWSGNKRAFELAEIARGQLVNLCRRGRLFSRPTVGRGDGLGWQAWAAGESRKRLGACVLLLDGFFPALLATPSYISQGELSNMVFPCDRRYWEAPDAQTWQAMLGMAPIPPSPFFASSFAAILTPRYVLRAQKPDPHLNSLAGLILMNSLQHHIYDLRQQLHMYTSAGMTVPMYAGAPDYTEDAPQPVNMALGFEGRKQWLSDALELWRKHYSRHEEGEGEEGEGEGEGQADPFMRWGQSLLWMSVISLHVDVQDLNDAAGQHGPKAASAAIGRLSKWALTSDATSSCTAAVQLLRTLSTTTSPGPYAPLCCFAATLTLAASLSLGDSNQWEEGVRGRLEGLLGDGQGGVEGEEAHRRVRRLGARLLRGMRAWRVAESLESILLRAT